MIMESPPDSLSPPMTGKNKISPSIIFGSKTCKSPHDDGGAVETLSAQYTVRIGRFRFETNTHFFYKQPHFPVEPRVTIRSAQNEAQNCYEVANVFWRL